jgi:hypothetical protein
VPPVPPAETSQVMFPVGERNVRTEADADAGSARARATPIRPRRFEPRRIVLMSVSTDVTEAPTPKSNLPREAGRSSAVKLAWASALSPERRSAHVTLAITNGMRRNRPRQDDSADEKGGVSQLAAPDDQPDWEAAASDRAGSRVLADHATESPGASAADSAD